MKNQKYHEMIYNQTIDNIESEIDSGRLSIDDGFAMKEQALDDLYNRLINSNLYTNEDFNMIANFSEYSNDLYDILNSAYGDDIESGIYELAIASEIHPEIIEGYLTGDLDCTNDEFIGLTHALNEGLNDLSDYYNSEYDESDDYDDDYYYYDDGVYYGDDEDDYYYEDEPLEGYAYPAYPAYQPQEELVPFSAYEDALSSTIAEFSDQIAFLQNKIDDLEDNMSFQASAGEIAIMLDNLLDTSENMLEEGWMTPAQQEAIFSPDLVFADDDSKLGVFLSLTEQKGSDPYDELEQINDHLEVLAYNGAPSARESLMAREGEFAASEEIMFIDEVYPGAGQVLSQDPAAIWDIVNMN
jgi:hypothetical protein